MFLRLRNATIDSLNSPIKTGNYSARIALISQEPRVIIGIVLLKTVDTKIKLSNVMEPVTRAQKVKDQIQQDKLVRLE